MSSDRVCQLVLWDIDGTLVHGGGTGLAAFEAALTRVVGRLPAEYVLMSGKTDPQIVAEYLEQMGEPEERGEEVLVQLELAMAASADVLVEEGRALLGAAQAVELVSSLPGVLSSVLTGNIRPNAELKLAAFGLDRWMDLSVGAYGSDHADRRELVAVALERVAERYRVTLSPSQVWIIGDTPRDLECARHGGARCVLVASGRFGRDELAAEGPDALFDDLTDVEGLLAALGIEIPGRRQ